MKANTGKILVVKMIVKEIRKGFNKFEDIFLALKWSYVFVIDIQNSRENKHLHENMFETINSFQL
jgi:hypothetical protein